ncbi:MAG: Holliday junction branch migration protein RuvA [bacterium]
MIGSLRGKILSKKPDGAIIETNGVGYHVYLSLNTLASLPSEGSTVFLTIHTHVRDDAILLYGFLSEEEKKIFTTLLGVSGIGPKLALNILSGLPVEGFLEAIETENTAVLSKIPGVGKKTANRLILELREKLPASPGRKDPVYEDVLSALINLGYKKNIAADALDKVYQQGEKNIESLLKESLKYLTNE